MKAERIETGKGTDVPKRATPVEGTAVPSRPQIEAAAPESQELGREKGRSKPVGMAGGAPERRDVGKKRRQANAFGIDRKPGLHTIPWKD